MRVDETLANTRRRSPLAWTLRIAALTLVLGCGCAHYLSRLHVAPARGGQIAARALPDPETTGSITGAARSIRLDPCALVERVLAPRPATP
ncbi:hypothetical protein [Methylobacterium segetis]|uniref:hypothetical protein n=1 Tax=Methylobacterium segetis TaxID=2488750 RepID=UPI00104724CF|nr:hypothetical protein [Methylobacterium segetis]